VSVVGDKKFLAFLSYSHADTKCATWLHRYLEAFPIDKLQPSLGRRSFRPIARDRDDFPAAKRLTEATIDLLDNSEALIVLCSPDSARSRYVDDEIRLFATRYSGRPIIPIIADSPSTAPDEDRFPRALLNLFRPDAPGAPMPAILAADMRPDRDGRILAAAKVIAALLDVPTDAVFQRAARIVKRQRRVRAAVVSIIALLIGSFLVSAVFAWGELKTNENFKGAVLTRATELLTISVSQAEEYGVPRRATLEILQAAERLLDDISFAGKVTDTIRHRKAWMSIQFARNYALLGDSQKQRERALSAREALLALSAQTPANVLYKQDLAFAYNEVGDVLSATGDLETALMNFKEALLIRQTLASHDPHNASWQRDLSVSLNKVGDVQFAQGDVINALAEFRAALLIRRALSTAEPENSTWRRDLAVAYSKIGNALLAQKEFSEALIAFTSSLSIFQDLVKMHPRSTDLQRDLAITNGFIGDIHFARGEWPSALTAFTSAIEILSKLSLSDPDHLVVQRDLSSLRGKLGDVFLSQARYDDAVDAFQLSADGLERLSKRDASNVGWQRDLAVVYTKVADVLAMQGSLERALMSYGRSNTVFSQLVTRDKTNADWQRSWAVSYERIADVYEALGRTDEALQAYESALAVYESFMKVKPDNVQIVLSATLPLIRLGVLSPGSSKKYFRRAIELLRQLERMGVLGTAEKNDLLWLEQRALD
jgi:tetratricopeptide (TPR) repeat protein